MGDQLPVKARLVKANNQWGMKVRLGDKLNSKVSIIRFVPGDVRIYQKNSFSGVVLNDIGFKRPPLQDKDEFAIKGITKEQIPNVDGRSAL